MANIDKLRLSGVTYTIVDSTALHSLPADIATTGDVKNATDALAESIAEQGYQNATQVNNAITAITNPINQVLTAHTANTEIHVTVADKTTWNAKLDASDIEGLFGFSEYDSATHRINFKNTSTGTVLSYIDASPFIVDGMVSNVEVKDVTGKGTCLVITFNSDAGKQAIEIPITQIFDASNYYTTAQTQAYVSGYTYDKATIDQKVADGGRFDPALYYDKTATDALLANKADTATTYTKSEVDTALGNKQDTLVSGTNIKTVGTQSVLGSGNISLMTAKIGTGNDNTTLIFEFA